MPKLQFDYPGASDFSGAPDRALDSVAWRDPIQCAARVDLTRYEDDVTVLKNPHKGWFWHYIDNGFSRSAYRAEHDASDRLEDFPGLNHLYLRYDWGDIEREEGKPDWSQIDRIMDEWGRYGYTFSMRICAFEGDAGIPFATPEYVYKAGAKCYRLSDGKLEPFYDDPIFLEKLEAFLRRAGEKFDGDRRVELIDIGTFGTWGEGHTSRGSCRMYPAEAIKKHIDLHVKAFPHLPILMNDDHVNAAWAGRTEAENLDLIRYARTLGLGLQDDSVCVAPYADANGYTTLRSPWLFDLFWENAPTVLEFEHYHMVAPGHHKQGLPFLEAMRRTHCTFAGFHGYPRPWLEREPYLTEYAANRLGYWYFLRGYELPMIKLGARNILRLWVENRGYAPAYRDYTLRVTLRGEGGVYSQDFPADNVKWLPEQEVRLTLPLLPENMAAGSYGIYVGLFEEDRPVAFAFDPRRRENGMCRVGNVEAFQ